ncbi:kinase-like domain-containing protein [Lasiosphaeria ovina]|uniref:Kinase-like domain-containing protein n=1 Tax=Lasiosphaeria ovina TaxID=92902 RepID=A0AAE0TV36_9PEZI|nr:kinase-like domain-containing protein [Lasiosphaeria ovina]
MNNKHFIPNQQLNLIIDNKTVSEELTRIERAFRNRPKRWLRWIRKGYRTPSSGTEMQNRAGASGCLRKIFAILLLINRHATIKKFIDEGLCDAHLPLTITAKKDPIFRTPVMALHRRDGTEVRCMRFWRRRSVESFVNWQWSVLSPILKLDHGGKLLHYSFDDNVILPFTSYEFRINSGHAEIFYASIHPEHHDCHPEGSSATRCFAVKKIGGDNTNSLSQSQFKQEVCMLKRVRHDHVIALLATYEQNNSYHLILPRAECDLARYWSSRPEEVPGIDLSTVQWMAQQCEGIAMGLSAVHHHLTSSMSSLASSSSSSSDQSSIPRSHRYFGIHGDIKPSNILWFPCADGTDMGTLKIADFGVGKFNRTERSTERSDSVPLTLSYRPPESDARLGTPNGGEDVEVSPAYDVWSLGCVYLEFVTWYVGGQRLLDGFRQARGPKPRDDASFFQIADTASRAEVKPAVLKVRS